MTRLWTIIGVRNVPASVAWYQALLALPASAPAHDYFGQVIGADGTVLLCLHAWEEHGHPTLTSPERAAPGNGLLLFFRVDDVEAALVERVRRPLVLFDEEVPGHEAVDEDDGGAVPALVTEVTRTRGIVLPHRGDSR